MAKLADLSEEIYNCCVNSCCAFTGTYSDLDLCPYCHEPRYNESGAPCQLYRYTPLLPHVQSMYLNKTMVHQLSYRSKYKAIPGEINDVFDGSNYQSLLGEKVENNGTPLSHKCFSDPRDVAIGLMIDGFHIFKRQR
ncbi:uncharacterized protein EI90DRAFT_2933104, partial [Cantharellus anzutake]|uniref:uncharacterized protein n=1 Tax=Cantharellus anzutake TaxID=1750568 RepID=UPI0019031B13